MIFETDRLSIQKLKGEDGIPFFDLMSNPKVMELIPQDVLTKEQSDSTLQELIALERSSDTKIYGLYEKLNNVFIGFCGFLKNDINEDEIAYRIREQFWGKGYGTEIAKGLIAYGFANLNSDLITADVSTENVRSIKILEKFFVKEKEFFNENDNCIDRRYVLKKQAWIKSH